MNKTYIGIDNGVTGSIGVITEDEAFLIRTPTKSEQNYTKKKGNVTRVVTSKLKEFLNQFDNVAMICLERPMVNPKRFQASTSALRALEATLVVIEELGLPHEYIDSKEWQKELLPKGIKGAPELKKASMDIGARLFPQHKDVITSQKDADGILIAEYCRRKYG